MRETLLEEAPLTRETRMNRNLFLSSVDRYLEQGVCLTGGSHVNGDACYCSFCWPMLTDAATLPFLSPWNSRVEKINESGPSHPLLGPQRKHWLSSKREEMLSTSSSYFFSFDLYFIFCVWVLCLHVCICTICVPGAFRDQKRVSGPLELESQML